MIISKPTSESGGRSPLFSKKPAEGGFCTWLYIICNPRYWSLIRSSRFPVEIRQRLLYLQPAALSLPLSLSLYIYIYMYMFSIWLDCDVSPSGILVYLIKSLTASGGSWLVALITAECQPTGVYHISKGHDSAAWRNLPRPPNNHFVKNFPQRAIKYPWTYIYR